MQAHVKAALLDDIDEALDNLGPSRPSAPKVTRARTLLKDIKVACQNIAISPVSESGEPVTPPTPGPETPPIDPAPPETPPSGGGGGGSTSPPTTTTVTTTYTSQGDFVGTQGYRGWTYLDTNLAATLTYDNARALWTGPELYQFIWNEGSHSGPTTGVVRRWTAPNAGTFSITGNARYYNDPIGGTSGMPITIKKNGAAIYGPQIVADDDFVGYTIANVTGSVVAGDTLDFIVGPPSGPGTAHENLITTFSIALTTTTTSGGGSSTQTALPFTLNGTAPEEGTYTITANKPSNADGCTIDVTGVNLAASYGRLYFNGTSNSVALWATNPANAGISATVSVSVPVAYLVNGSNTLRFTHDSGSGYTVTAIAAPVFTTPATPTPPATQTSLPFDLRGSILPEDAILTLSLSKPSNANGATMTVTGVNLTGTQGAYYVNGTLASPVWADVPANAGVSATVTRIPDVSLFQNGNNAIRFTHTAGTGYTVSSVAVAFSTPAPGTTPPPPPTNTGEWPNQPSNMTVINDWGHGALTGGGWYDVYGGYSSSIVSDATAPLSAPSVLQQRFPQGLVGGNGGGGGSLCNFGSYYPSVYWGFWMKVDANFEQHPVLTKIGWLHARLNGAPSINSLFLALEGAYPGPYGISLNYQQNNIDNSHVPGGGFGTIRLLPGTGFFPAGSWARIEVYFRQSTTNTSQDGIYRLWVNGTSVKNITTLNTDRNFPDAVSHITIWGGTGTTKTRDSYIWFDHERVAVL